MEKLDGLLMCFLVFACGFKDKTSGQDTQEAFNVKQTVIFIQRRMTIRSLIHFTLSLILKIIKR
jgi:hypothetical protein